MNESAYPKHISYIILDDDGFTPSKYESRIPELINAVLHENELHRSASASALALFEKKASAAVPALRTAMNDECGDVRISAARALWKIARDETPVFNSLMETIESKDVLVRHRAAPHLSHIAHEFSPERALIVLRRMIRDRDESDKQASIASKYVRRCGVTGLSKMHPEIPGVIDALKEALNDPDEEVRDVAQKALR